MLGPSSLGAQIPVDPLLEPRWATGILTAALATDTRKGPPDLDRLVDELARLRVPAPIPRRKRLSINAGVHVIVDFSEDMFAVRDDVFWILSKLSRVFGEEHLTVLRCAGRPWTEIGPGPHATWGPYQPPTVRQPVLVITNFGLSVPGAMLDEATPSRAEWLTLAMELDRLRCPVIALVPNDVERVPPQLRRYLAVVEWDWTTTAASARRTVRR